MRTAALLAVASMLVALLGFSSGTASAVTYPVESTFSVAGPYATTTATAANTRMLSLTPFSRAWRAAGQIIGQTLKFRESIHHRDP